MVATVRDNHRYRYSGRSGLVRIDPAMRRGLPGRVEDELLFYQDDGSAPIPVAEDDLREETDER